MKEEDVAKYLQQNPKFFETYAEMLSQISIPHPMGGRAIPIADRQLLTLREKTRMLEAKLAELIQFGEENDALSEKVHRLSLALLGARDVDSLVNALYLNLHEDFSIPHSKLRLWCEPALPLPEFAPVETEAREFAESLPRPYCGPAQGTPVVAWFGEAAPHLRSLAAVPLRNGGSQGLLVMASEDSQRFYPEMGTLYLDRIADVLSAAVRSRL
jgi:uncharacterized protein